MDLFEYQGKQFFAKYGMPTSPGKIAFTVDEAVQAAEELGTPVMVKAQVHTGGRGKAGGVKFAATIEDVTEHASNILGLDIKGAHCRKGLDRESFRHSRRILCELYPRQICEEASRDAFRKEAA